METTKRPPRNTSPSSLPGRSSARLRISARTLLLVLIVLGLALMLDQLSPTWAAPSQNPHRDTIDTIVPTPTNGPTATGTATPGPCTGRVLLQQGSNGYMGTTDTFIYAWDPNWPQTGSMLRIKGGESKSTLIRFDLADKLPAGAEIIEAELVFFVESGERIRPLQASAYRVLRPWSGSSATWNSASSGQPWGASGCNQVDVDRVGTPDDTATLEYRAVYQGLDVTDSVRHWVAHPSENYGWLIKGAIDSTGEFLFYGSEWKNAYSPILRIDYALCAVTPTNTPTEETPTPTVTPTGATETPSITPTLTPATPTATPAPTTAAFGAVQDTYIDAWAPTTAALQNGYLKLRAPDVKKMLVQFDLSGLPERAFVTSATLQLRTTSFSPAGKSMDVVAYRLLKCWSETTATWEQAAAGDPWNSAGASGSETDYYPLLLDSVVVSQPDQNYSWDVTLAVQQWVNAGAGNCGLVLSGRNANVEHSFIASESSSEAYRPQLLVTYYVAYPTATPTPTPSITPTPTITSTPTEASGLQVLVYEDANGNGQHDPGEQGIPNAVIELLNLSWQKLDTQITDQHGICLFANWQTGEYRLKEINAPWYCSTTDDIIRIYHGSGRTLATFGDYRCQGLALPILLRGE